MIALSPKPRYAEAVTHLGKNRSSSSGELAAVKFPSENTVRRWLSDPMFETEATVLSSSGFSSLDAPRRLVDLSTGLPTLTSLFKELRPLADESGETVILYVHIPSSPIVEERFGWEALETFKGLIANFLVGFSKHLRRERSHCVLLRAYADDFVLLLPYRDQDNELPSMLADDLVRHLSAIDEETAALLQIYVGMAQGKPFPKIHPERFLYRLIQKAQTEATDVQRQRISALVRVLDRCISGEQFEMHYQPIVRVEDHKIFAHEALVRCHQKELRNPHTLFNIAEQGERVWPLSRLLRRMAIDAVPQLPPNVLMFINIHPGDFDDPELWEPLDSLREHASRIVLEVTERAAILDFEQFRRKLAELRQLGLRIAVDDLGSGYSSLNVVAELQPDFIKIDMTLIRGIDESPVRQNLLRNMISFAVDLDAQLIAEGVETRNELKTLKELGCPLVQGFYLAMPSPPFITSIEPPPIAGNE